MAHPGPHGQLLSRLLRSGGGPAHQRRLPHHRRSDHGRASSVSVRAERMSFPAMLWVFLKASMLSSGGLQALPLLREDLIVAHPWLTNADFATAIAIGRITPGPNGLFTLSVGYF